MPICLYGVNIKVIIFQLLDYKFQAPPQSWYEEDSPQHGKKVQRKSWNMISTKHYELHKLPHWANVFCKDWVPCRCLQHFEWRPVVRLFTYSIIVSPHRLRKEMWLQWCLPFHGRVAKSSKKTCIWYKCLNHLRSSSPTNKNPITGLFFRVPRFPAETCSLLGSAEVTNHWFQQNPFKNQWWTFVR